MPQNRKEFSRSRAAPSDEFGPRSPAALSITPSLGQQGQPGKSGTSFAARFGRVILQHGVAAIPSALYHYQGKLGLTAQQVWFISYILAHKWAEALPHPSLNKMAQCTGVDRRVLQYRCVELTNLGLLQIYPRYGDKGDQGTNYFDFAGLFEQLEAVLLDEQPVPNPIRDGEYEPGTSIAPVSGVRKSTTGIGTVEGVTASAELDLSFLARYGRVLLRYGIATVPKAVFTHQGALGLTPQQVWFVCYILSFQWDASLPYPSLNKMAERTGYSKRQLLRIKDELVSAGYLEVLRRTGNNHGNDTNAYDFRPLLETIDQQLQGTCENEGDQGNHADECTPAPVQPRQALNQNRRAPQPRQRGTPAPRNTSIRPSYEQPSVTKNPIAQDVTREVEFNVTREVVQHDITRIEQGVTTPVTRFARGPRQEKSPGGQKWESPEIETINIETLHKDDSNQLSQKIGDVKSEVNEDVLVYSKYIAAIASDFSRELEDPTHEASNMKQALNLWHTSGLDEQRFVELMHQAKKLTRKYQSRPTWDAMNNKMAYFYTTLRDLVDPR